MKKTSLLFLYLMILALGPQSVKAQHEIGLKAGISYAMFDQNIKEAYNTGFAYSLFYNYETYSEYIFGIEIENAQLFGKSYEINGVQGKVPDYQFPNIFINASRKLEFAYSYFYFQFYGGVGITQYNKNTARENLFGMRVTPCLGYSLVNNVDIKLSIPSTIVYSLDYFSYWGIQLGASYRIE